MNKIVNWLKNRIAATLVALVQCILLAVIPFSASAQTTPKAPEIPAALVTKFFKAHSESTDANMAVINAQKAVEAKVQVERQVIGELQAACGEKFQANLDAQGNPVCTAKPAPAKPEPKK